MEPENSQFHFLVVTSMLVVLLLMNRSLFASHSVLGTVTKLDNKPLVGVEIFLMPNGLTYYSDSNGQFAFHNLKKGNYELIILLEGYETVHEYYLIEETINVSIQLKRLEIKLTEVVVAAQAEKHHQLRKMRAVEGTSIFAGKKTEVILLDNLIANTAANNPRQIYAQVAGLNIYDANDAGLQLNIGGRGLDPNRTSNFNTRQNGYDISADVLGYPESYYSPPAEALDEIQIIRGAASLQYGSQFGGLVNFIFKKPNPTKKIEWTSRQTLGSNALFTSFNSVNGSLSKFSYYTYFNYKKGNDFRPNSSFESNNLYGYFEYNFTPKSSLNAQITYLSYLSQQAGGLTDAQFVKNPNYSNRSRNWFKVNWKLWALQYKYKLTNKTDLSLQANGLFATRDAIGFRSNRVSQNDDLKANRDLLKGKFNNWSTENRILHRFSMFNRNTIAILGFKYFQSQNLAIQGAGSNATTADFDLHNDDFPTYPFQSNFEFPNQNFAFFGENIFYLNKYFSITPGFRFEYIKTQAQGTYRAIDFDLPGNPIRDTSFIENQEFQRNKVLLGVGLSYKTSKNFELYGNFSQNYRSVTFNDIRTVNPVYQIDPNITDENGFNADVGFRGKTEKIHIDASAFALFYNDRLGEVLTPQTRINAEGIEIQTGKIVRLRSNIGSAIIYGVESLIDWNIINPNTVRSNSIKLNIFSNLALTHSNYIKSKVPGVMDKKVEFIPQINLKTGISFGFKDLLTSIQFTYISSQYTDASNAPQDPSDNQSGIIGSIPGYHIADLAVSYRFKFIKIETGINNLLNSSYFTRRATGYPGPGIIPSAPQTFYLTLQVKI